MAKDILVLTGASGFLGRYLARELSHDFMVRAVTHHELRVKGVSDYKIGDLKNSTFLEQALKGSNVVVHCAAITNTTDPDLESVNVHYTERLVLAAKAVKVKTFVYISTENVTYHCQDPYTKSKAQAESIVLKSFKNALIFRPSLIFGRGDKRYLGSFVKAIRTLPLVPVFSRSVCTLQPIHVKDVAKLILQGLRLNKKGVFTLVGGDPVSFSEIGHFLAQQMGKTRLFVPIPGFLIKGFSSLLALGPKKAKRLHFMLENAFLIRNVNVKSLEENFDYTLPPLKERLKDIFL